jgi:hypothetical protein
MGKANNFESEITSQAIKVKPKTISHRATVCPPHGQPLFLILGTAAHHAKFERFICYCCHAESS